MNHKKKLARVVVLLIIIAGGAWYFIANYATDHVTLKGVVETTAYSHVAEVQGKVMEVPVGLGQKVQQGDVLVEIDPTDMEYALNQLELTLVQKQAVLNTLEIGTDQELIEQAQNAVSAANATYEKASRDYQTALQLYQAGGTSQNSLDTAKYQLDLAKAGLASANQQVTLLRSGADETAITAAEAAVDQMESQIEQMKDDLEKFTIRANCDGIVVSQNYTLGDLVSLGYNLIDVAATEEAYLLAYLPVDLVPNVDYGQSISIRYDGEEYSGELIYVDVKSEYTPKEFKTAANKNKDSIKIKVKLPAELALKPGQTGQIYIPK